MDYINDIRSIIELYLEENDTIENDLFYKDDLQDLISYCHQNLELHYDTKVDIKRIEAKIKELMETVYIYVPEEPKEKLDEAYEKLEAHYNYLLNLPQPEQKS